MTDKSWMLNAKAIRAAKTCIQLVEEELGIKLRLSNPDFLTLLTDYAELNESAALTQALCVLAQYAPTTIQHQMVDPSKSNVLNLKNKPQQTHYGTVKPTILFRGKTYMRYQDGKEFKGLYRGQPHYAK